MSSQGSLHHLTVGVTLALMSAGARAELAPAQNEFFQAISALCGKAFAGKLVAGNASDDKMRAQPLVMHVRECSEDEIKVPFHVGTDRSRTWVISKTATGLRLKHDHRHEDGSADKITMYGGDTSTSGSKQEQRFPADQHSKAMFYANNMAVSAGNTWIVAIKPGQSYEYALVREGREFRVEFDLSKPIATPPPPWGHK